MKKIASALLALILLLSCCAFAEEEMNALRITADNVIITFGDDEYAPDMSASLDIQAADDALKTAFVLNRGERELLPVAVGLAADGVKLRLGSSSVYHFAPEFLFGEGEPSADGYRTLITALPKLDDVALLYAFRDYLNEQPEDFFTLTGDDLLDWLNSELAKQDEALPELLAWLLWNEPVNAGDETASEPIPADGEAVVSSNAGEAIVKEAPVSGEDEASEVFALNVERMTGGYLLQAGDVLITLVGADVAELTPAEEAALGVIGGADGPTAVMAAIPGASDLKDSAAAVISGSDALIITVSNFAESSGAMPVHSDEATAAKDDAAVSNGDVSTAFLAFNREGGVYLCANYEYNSEYWRSAQGVEVFCQPAGEGEEFSFICASEEKYHDASYFQPDTSTRLSVTGSTENIGLATKVEYLQTSSAVSDLRVTFDLSGEVCKLRDDLSGKTITVTDDLSDTGSMGLSFAAMGLMGDLESILSDEVITTIADRWNEMYTAASDAFYARLEELTRTVDDLPYAVPEFTWMPEGFVLEEASVSDYSDVYRLSYLRDSERQDYIQIYISTGENTTSNYSIDENRNLIEHAKADLTYELSENYTSANLYRNGLKVNIYTYSYDEDDYRLTIEDVQSIVRGMVWPEE